MRQDATDDGATAADAAVMESATAPTSIGATEACAYKYTTIPITASADTAAHIDPVEVGGHFSTSKKWAVLNVTGSGAWSFEVRVDAELDV